MLGAVYLETQRAVQAEEALEGAVARGAADGFTLTNLGMAQLGQGRADDAVATLRRAVASSPELPQAHYTLGMALEDAGDASGSNRAYCRAAELAPGVSMFAMACDR